MGGWTGSDDRESSDALDCAVALGCNFFDTAWAYGEGHSEHLLGELVRANPGKPIYTATKIPPKNFRWPSRRGDPVEAAFPPDVQDALAKALLAVPASQRQFYKSRVWAKVTDNGRARVAKATPQSTRRSTCRNRVGRSSVSTSSRDVSRKIG